MQDAAGGGDIHLLLTILADGEEQARKLELGEPVAAADGQSSYPGGHRRGEEYYRGVARQLQCTFTKAMAVARAIEAAAGAGASGSRGTTGGSRSDSADESSGRTARDVLHQERQDVPKRRKGALPRWTEKFRVADANLEATPEDDGFSWRKYGQKDILGAKFPRGYYRCTYRNAQGCPATKQVQRSDTDLCVFYVTYQGVHTCHQKHRRGGNQPPPPAPSQDLSVELLRNFNDGLKVETDELAAPLTFEQNGAYGAAGQFFFPSVPFHAGVTPPPDDAFLPVKSGAQLGGGGGFYPKFVSPAQSAVGSSYFSMAHCYDYEQQGGQFFIRGTGSSELDEVVSAATAAATTTAVATTAAATTAVATAVHPAAFDYPLYHHVELDPHLPLAPMFDPASMHGPFRNA
ncbi:hypothetical protein ABZP36_012014 [Zizania latifolia]